MFFIQRMLFCIWTMVAVALFVIATSIGGASAQQPTACGPPLISTYDKVFRLESSCIRASPDSLEQNVETKMGIEEWDRTIWRKNFRPKEVFRYSFELSYQFDGSPAEILIHERFLMTTPLFDIVK